MIILAEAMTWTQVANNAIAAAVILGFLAFVYAITKNL